METTSKLFDGLVVKENDKSVTGFSDCALCCLNCNPCKDCPLQSGYYFVERSKSSDSPVPSPMSEQDIKRIDSVISDLDWLSKHLKDSIRLHLLSSACVELAKTYIDCCFSSLNRIKTFDK